MLTQEFQARHAYQDVQRALEGLRAQVGSIVFATPQDVSAVHGLVEKVLEALGSATAAMERQMREERVARAESERIVAERVTLLQAQLSETRENYAAALASLTVEREARERAEGRSPVVVNPPAVVAEAAEYRLKATRGADGKIDLENVVIQRIPSK